MDIKPFNYVLSWDNSAIAIISGIVVCLVFLTLAFRSQKKYKGLTYATILCMMIATFGAGMVTTVIMAANVDTAYADHVSNFKKSIEENGFSFVTGKLNLHPNNASSVLLQYEGKNFDCTMFAPEDVNKNVVFSCGEAKLTLEDIKKSASE